MDFKYTFKTILIVTILCIAIIFVPLSCGIKKATTVQVITDTLVIPSSQAVDTEYYATVEKQAVYLNGDVDAFRLFVKKATRYPANSIKKKQQGTTVLQAGVDCYGSMNVLSVLKSSGFKVLDDEAIRAVKLSPKWQPAELGNKKVGQLLVLQLKFDAKRRSVTVK